MVLKNVFYKGIGGKPFKHILKEGKQYTEAHFGFSNFRSDLWVSASYPPSALSKYPLRALNFNAGF